MPWSRHDSRNPVGAFGTLAIASWKMPTDVSLANLAESMKRLTDTVPSRDRVDCADRISDLRLAQVASESRDEDDQLRTWLRRTEERIDTADRQLSSQREMFNEVETQFSALSADQSAQWARHEQFIALLFTKVFAEELPPLVFRPTMRTRSHRSNGG